MLNIPLQNASDCKVTVTSTATKIYDLIDTASSTTNAQQYYDQKYAGALSIQAEDGDIRWLEGATPTATEGNLIKQGQKEWLPGVSIFDIKLIRAGSADVKVTVVPYRGEPNDSPALMAGEVFLEAADIQIGAVEIKDGDSDVRLDVELDSTKNASFVQSESLATSAKQLPDDHQVTANAGTNLNTSALALESGGNLDTIAGDTTSIDGKVSLAANQLPDGHNVTVDNAGGGSAVNIQDGGNSITVDATDLDIRDLTHVSDSVKIGDGTDLADVVTAADDDTNLDGTNGLVTNAIANFRIDADTVKPARMDASTHSIQTMSYEHHEIHAGSHYCVYINKDIPNAGTYNIAFTTPNTTKWVHMLLTVDVQSEAAIQLYEDITSFTGGTAITPYNNDRNSVNTSGITDMAFDVTPTLGTPILLAEAVEGSGRSFGGGVRSQQEWVLKQDTVYYLLVTNQTAGTANETNVSMCYYEHTNKS